MLQMNMLDVRKVKLVDDELDVIASCISNIESLKIGSSSGIKGLRALAEAILKRKKPVSYC